MKVEQVDIDMIEVDPENARRHTAESIAAIARSLRRFGQRTPLVVSAAGVAKKGNGTLLAARQLGWKKVWITRAADLSARELRAYALADNRTGELSDFDPTLLVEQLRELSYVPEDEDAVLLDLGWTEAELDKLLAPDPEAPPPDAGERAKRAQPIQVTEDQRAVFTRALVLMREQNPQLSEGQAVELLAADFLQGPHGGNYGA